MRIVQQSALDSHCVFPPLLLLPAPHITGLLSARVPSSLPSPSQITVIKPRKSLLDRQRAIWAAQDAEIETFLEGARQRLAAVYAEVNQDTANRYAHTFLWEIAS